MASTLLGHDVLNPDNVLYYLDTAGQVRTVCPSANAAAVARWPYGLAEFLAAWDVLPPEGRMQRWSRALSSLRPVIGPFLVAKNRSADGFHVVGAQQGIRFGTVLVERIGITRTPTGVVRIIPQVSMAAPGCGGPLWWAPAGDFFLHRHVEFATAS